MREYNGDTKGLYGEVPVEEDDLNCPTPTHFRRLRPCMTYNELVEKQLKEFSARPVPTNKFIFMEEAGKLNPEVLKYISEEEAKSIETCAIYNNRSAVRIMAIKDFGDVKAGTIGGYLECEDNLSQTGKCWVADTSIVVERAKVLDDAQVTGNSRIFDDAKIADSATVKTSYVLCTAIVAGNACVVDSNINTNVFVGNNININNCVFTGTGLLNCEDGKAIKFNRYVAKLTGTNEGFDNLDDIGISRKYYPGETIEGE